MIFLNPLNQVITDWHDQRIWIIGASSGIGAALAQAFIDKGAKCILSARRLEKLEEIANSKALTIAFDVQNTDEWAQAYAQITTSLGGVDMIIFCAASYRPERSWEVKTEFMQSTLKTNIHSVYHGLQLVLPPMLANKKGGIAIIASVAGYIGLPNASVYGPSKAALINLAEILYTDLHPSNINVHLINPGFVKTELTAKNSFTMPALQTPEQAAQAIIKGMEKGDFEIHFPRRFTMFLKALQLLPYRLRFALMKYIQPNTH